MDLKFKSKLAYVVKLLVVDVEDLVEAVVESFVEAFVEAFDIYILLYININI